MDMGLSQDQSHKQKQKQKQTQTLRQRLSLAATIDQQQVLELSNALLAEHVRQKVMENNYLEHHDKTKRAEQSPKKTKQLDGYGPIAARPRTDLTEKHYRMLQNLPGRSDVRTSLRDHLLAQLRDLAVDRNDFDFAFAEFLIDEIDKVAEFGMLNRSLPELHVEFESRVGKVTYATAVQTLSLVQQFSPPGAAALNDTERVLLMLRHVANTKDDEIGLDPPLRHVAELKLIVSQHMDDLKARRFAHVADTMRISQELLEGVLHELKRLLSANPFNVFAKSTEAVVPDIVVRESTEGELTCRVNDRAVPSVYVPTCFLADQELRRRIESNGRERAKFEEARRLVAAIELRRSTLERIAADLFFLQAEFFRRGREHLKPLTQRDLAARLHRSEPTVSRALKNKWIDTPHGIYPLKTCFPGKVKMSGCTPGDVERVLHAIISSESKDHPYSDGQLAEKLREHGVCLERRAVSNYRKKLGYETARSRRRTALKRCA